MPTGGFDEAPPLPPPADLAAARPQPTPRPARRNRDARTDEPRYGVKDSTVSTARPLESAFHPTHLGHARAATLRGTGLRHAAVPRQPRGHVHVARRLAQPSLNRLEGTDGSTPTAAPQAPASATKPDDRWRILEINWERATQTSAGDLEREITPLRITVTLPRGWFSFGG